MMIVLRTKLVHLIRAGAVTVYPFIFISPNWPESDLVRVLSHEGIHGLQQRRWLIWGLGVGLVAWWLLYALALPVWRNPWRERWEREAYRDGDGFDDERITRILRQPPYYLWGLKP